MSEPVEFSVWAPLPERVRLTVDGAVHDMQRDDAGPCRMIRVSAPQQPQFGSVDDVSRRIEEFAEAGVQHFELKFMYPTLDDLLFQMELWAETILAEYGAKVTV